MLNVDTIDFYPTPKQLITKMIAGVDWKYVNTILEPSAGKGDLADFVSDAWQQSYWRTHSSVDIDCIELNSDLQATLKGKGYRVIHNDFLTFRTFKSYDLIIMNPPFSQGCKHLLAALDIQKNGGAIICLLNAETIKNPYTNERKDLVNRLNELNAQIEFVSGAFSQSEHPTDVEVALIKVDIPRRAHQSDIWESLKRKSYAECKSTSATDLVLNDYIKAIIAQYNLELEAGIKLIRESQAMAPHIMHSLKESAYDTPILEIRVNDKKDFSINDYVCAVRYKYWAALFSDHRFTGKMTSEQREQYLSKVDTLKNYDFSEYNITTLQLEMSQTLISGIEECIIKLFDELSRVYSYYGETSNNIHYYNGWKTNKSWIINKKVIIPFYNAFKDNYMGGKEFCPTDYYVTKKLNDIEKALDYLNGVIVSSDSIQSILYQAEQKQQTKKIPLKYFTVTFYKKGTCHIEFTNLELLKKLNIFGSQQKGWLPPSYGKARYDEMEPEEQIIIDEFEGKESYELVLNKSDYYLSPLVNPDYLIES